MTAPRQRFLRLRVRDIRDETPDARTLVLEPVSPASDTAYSAGQFLTLHLPVACDRTVAGSNWLFSRVNPGMILDVSPASGSFKPDPSDKPLHLFAAGVGITPIFSICKYALRATQRRVRLHYSSKSPGTALFREELARLEAAFAGRLTVNRHYSASSGRLDSGQVRVLLKHASESAA